ncbi:hypothetical protein W823_17525 [Williamsia sp. D3]|nr:hypothetical protein W823_17525 [Williamsia sp. D3]
MDNGSDAGFLVRQYGSYGRWEAPELTAYTDESHLQQVIAE